MFSRLQKRSSLGLLRTFGSNILAQVEARFDWTEVHEADICSIWSGIRVCRTSFLRETRSTRKINDAFNEKYLSECL